MNKTIKRYRKQKGWSQEEFSEQANVSLRTIQRIENNESNPSGKTLLLLCNALEISIEDLNIDTQHENKSFLSLFHLSALSFLIIPFGNIIIPLAFWLSKRDKIKGLRATGARLLNFQMIWSIVAYATLFIGVFGKLAHAEFKIFLYTGITLYAINIIIPIVFFAQTMRGKKIEYFNLIRVFR